MTYCIGSHCSCCSKCALWNGNAPLNKIVYVTDFSTMGWGQLSSTMPIDTGWYCGDNSHDYPMFKEKTIKIK